VLVSQHETIGITKPTSPPLVIDAKDKHVQRVSMQHLRTHIRTVFISLRREWISRNCTQFFDYNFFCDEASYIDWNID